MSRFGWFVLGIVFTLVVLALGGYLFVREGGIYMATTARPLPLERTVASMALEASFGNAAAQESPLPADETNLVAGARVFGQRCAGCHGLPGRPRTAFAQAMFPHPPQLFEPGEMVTDDPVGITHWKVTHGIRLSGMPAFESILSDTERWQVAMLLAHADKLPASAEAAFAR
jgi:thiosulfate dehydrogenase